MSKNNPLLGLVSSYGDSDEDSDEEVSSVTNTPAASVLTADTSHVGIHPAPIPHCPWSACYDESSGCTYYWNQVTNEVTWETPPEYLLALKLAQQHLHSSGSTEVSAEEWQLYQQALVEKQNSQKKTVSKPVVAKSVKGKDKTVTENKQKNPKSVKRKNSSEEEEKIELITSYYNSDSESNEEPESPAKPVAPVVTPEAKTKPKNPHKKQKTKSQTIEFGPSLPANQNYTLPIGPELPQQLVPEEKPNFPQSIPKSPENKLKSCENQPKSPDMHLKSPKNSPKSPENQPKFSENTVLTGTATKEIAMSNIKVDSEDIQDDDDLLKQLKDKAKLLEKLGGEIPSELQKIIEETSRTASPVKSPEENSEDSKITVETNIDDLLEEIEKKELPKVKSKEKEKIDMFDDESKKSTPSSPKSSGCQTPPLEELKALFPHCKTIEENAPRPLFPSAANITDKGADVPVPPAPPIEEVNEKKGTNLYIMDKKEPLENISKKKRRLENSVLPERKLSNVPSYTTKYSQYIEGFSSERTGLGFSKETTGNESPKKTINYGNGLSFTKGETLHEEKKDDALDDLTDLVEAKLKFLCQQQMCTITPVQEMLIQMQTLASAFRAGSLSATYWRRWADAADASLAQHEAIAAPPGWTCSFHRYILSATSITLRISTCGLTIRPIYNKKNFPILIVWNGT